MSGDSENAVNADEDTINQHEEEGNDHGGSGGMREVYLSTLKFENLSIKLDTLPDRVMSGIVSANGQLEVPPQHEATVTSILGANITSIRVIEGDRVSKGQILAYVSHPDLTQLQTDYVKSLSQLELQEKEVARQKRLYEEEVGAGQIYDQTLSKYEVMKTEIKGYEIQLQQINLDVDKVKNGDFYREVPVISPIDGYIEKVKVQIGQYADPQKELFNIVNTEHVHADLMVFEKDVHKVKKGQELTFAVESVPGKSLSAKIYSVGKQFEENPKAVHVHAEIENKMDFLIPGMYIKGQIQTNEGTVKALPEEAIIEEGGRSYVFAAVKHNEENTENWSFKPIEVRMGKTGNGWKEVQLMDPVEPGTLFAFNNAYYLIAEMKKSQTSHSH